MYVGNALERSAHNDTVGSKPTSGMVKTIPYKVDKLGVSALKRTTDKSEVLSFRAQRGNLRRNEQMGIYVI